MGSQKVVVLWDLDTSFSPGQTAENAVAAIRLLALAARGGEIRKMTAYYSSEPQQGSIRGNQAFRDYLRELTLHGFTPKDTAFLGGVESTAKSLIVDMLFEMMDAHKQPPMLLIITDDPTLRHPAEMLRNRHRVVHVKSSSDHQAALETVLAGGITQAHPGEATVGLALESPLLDASQAGIAVDAPLQEAQAQNPNLIPLGNQSAYSSMVSQVHPKYHALVEVLEAARDSGSLTLDKAKLGNRLAEKSKTLYRDAGAKDFKKYIAMAESDGIITVGGGGTEAWVTLKGTPLPSSGGTMESLISTAPSMNGFGYYS